jgi:hypothetical protein
VIFSWRQHFLVEDLKKALNSDFIKVKDKKNRIDLDFEGQAKTVLHRGSLRDNKAPTNTKSQQQPSTLETSQKPQDKR